MKTALSFITLLLLSATAAAAPSGTAARLLMRWGGDATPERNFTVKKQLRRIDKMDVVEHTPTGVVGKNANGVVRSIERANRSGSQVRVSTRTPDGILAERLTSGSRDARELTIVTSSPDRR